MNILTWQWTMDLNHISLEQGQLRLNIWDIKVIRPLSLISGSVPPQPQAQHSSSWIPVAMIMCTLISMVCGLIKPFWLIHVTCTCLKETAILFNVHLSCSVDFIRAQLTNTCSKLIIIIKKNFIFMYSELKSNTARHHYGVFIVDFDHS